MKHLMLVDNLPKHTLTKAAKQIEIQLSIHKNSAPLLKRGLLLYRLSIVKNINIEDGFVTARVLEERTYASRLNLTMVGLSYCTCEAKPLCPHLLALFFHLYSHIGAVDQLVDQWNRKRSGTALPLKKASDLLNVSSFQQSVNDWLLHFEQKYGEFASIKKVDAYEYIHQLCHRFLPSLRQEAPAKAGVKRLYSLHAGLFTLCELIKFGEQQEPFARYALFLESNVSHLLETIEDELYHLQHVAHSLRPLLEESISHVRTVLLTGKLFQLGRVNLYRSIWSVLFREKTWIEQERQILEKSYEITAERQLALAHLSFLEGEDEEAIFLLGTLQPFPLFYAVGWMEHIADQQEWNRLKTWLDASLPHIEDYVETLDHYDGHYLTRRLSSLFGAYADAVNEYAMYEKMLKAAFPYSSGEYSYFLFENGEYKKWVDLHLFLDMDVSEIDRSLLKVLEKEDRSLLLPLYHRSVSKMIQLKKRDSYKLAVKHLKKLRAHYRHLKREGEWTIYIARLIEENRRLRAFQEELKKGKFIYD